MKTNGASKYAGDAVSNPADLGYRQLKISSSFEVPRTNNCCLSLKRNRSNYKVLNDIVAQVEFHQTIPETRPLWQKRSLKQHVSASGQKKNTCEAVPQQPKRHKSHSMRFLCLIIVGHEVMHKESNRLVKVY